MYRATRGIQSAFCSSAHSRRGHTQGFQITLNRFCRAVNAWVSGEVASICVFVSSLHTLLDPDPSLTHPMIPP